MFACFGVGFQACSDKTVPYEQVNSQVELESDKLDKLKLLQKRPQVQRTMTAHGPQGEVDYFSNPTELFKLINWRQWNSAITRCNNAPDEVRTWIASRSDDGTIKWRCLPIHLVCMEEPIQDALLDALLQIYPHAARMKDNKGLLPIHYASNNGASSLAMELLLKAYPASISIKDARNRRPMDIAKASTNSNKQVTMLAIKRGLLSLGGIVSSFQLEDSSFCASSSQQDFISNSTEKEISPPPEILTVPHPQPSIKPPEKSIAFASNFDMFKEEFMEKQRNIECIEKDLAKTRAKQEAIRHQLQGNTTTEKATKIMMQEQVADPYRQTKVATTENETLTKRIEYLTERNIEYRTQWDEKNEEIVALREEYEEELDKLQSIIANLQSESSTSKAMSDALEAKLQSKFMSENILTSQVHELETKLENSAAAHAAAAASAEQQERALKAENTALKSSVTRLNENNLALQEKIKDLTESVISLASSLNSMSIDQERMINAAAKHENDIKEANRNEREALIKCIERQRKSFEAALAEQEELLGAATQNEEDIYYHTEHEREEMLARIEKKKIELEAFVCDGSVGSCGQEVTLQVEKSGDL